VVIDAIDDSSDLVPVAQSFRGFTAALVCKRVLFDLMVLLAAMIPTPGEAPDDYGANAENAVSRGGQGRDDADDEQAATIATFIRTFLPTSRRRRCAASGTSPN